MKTKIPFKELLDTMFEYNKTMLEACSFDDKCGNIIRERAKAKIKSQLSSWVDFEE